MKDVTAVELRNLEITAKAEPEEVEQCETRVHSLQGAVWAEESYESGPDHPGAAIPADL